MGESNAGKRPITILLADDHAVMRSGLRMLLDAEEDFEVVAEAGDIQSLFQQARGHRHEVLVLDLNMPGGSSIHAISTLARISPGTAVVVLTMEPDPNFMRQAYEAGASAYVLKEQAPTELVEAIRTAVRARR
ncbi:MAG TPA: response regulator transcription factor [Solirubrobacteraceae bacterium]|jgi:two-component system response regulator NreC|nr:response regulator transcription factor [Solirubrobacteraceae bacterium]